jgi:hypothetical protein
VSGFDITEEGIKVRVRPVVRWFSVCVDLLPTDDHPALLQGMHLPMWTDLDLPDFIEKLQENYSCVVKWMFPIPPPPNMEHDYEDHLV